MWQRELVQETSASAEAVWSVWSAIRHWPEWNAGIASIEVEGPFRAGTTFTMVAPDGERITLRLLEVVAGQRFVDVMDGGDFLVTTRHDVEPAEGGARITYRTEITGPAAETIGPELGPVITGDFPEVVAALIERAEREDAARA